MQLKVVRSQRKGGLMGGKSVFISAISAAYTQAEKDSINKYNLGGEVIYKSELPFLRNLVVTIASLQTGHKIECQDLGELLEAENTIHDACQNIQKYLTVAATFDGREVVIPIDA